jgi:hypothetical protein
MSRTSPKRAGWLLKSARPAHRLRSPGLLTMGTATPLEDFMQSENALRHGISISAPEPAPETFEQALDAIWVVVGNGTALRRRTPLEPIRDQEVEINQAGSAPNVDGPEGKAA